jgi:DNA-binding transcriptional regulator of glucitol operon
MSKSPHYKNSIDATIGYWAEKLALKGEQITRFRSAVADCIDNELTARGSCELHLKTGVIRNFMGEENLSRELPWIQTTTTRLCVDEKHPGIPTWETYWRLR